MTIVLSVSTVLLFVLIGIKHLELLKGNHRRFFEFQRNKLDRVTNRTFAIVRKWSRNIVGFIHNDVLLYVIHATIYIALLIVRYVERWLEKVTIFVRSFRTQKKRETSENLKIIQRENKETINRNK